MPIRPPCRCLAALAEWAKLSTLAREEWRSLDPHLQREMAPIAAAGAWNMGAWDEMEDYVYAIDNGAAPTSSANAFLRAVLSVHNEDYEVARGAEDSHMEAYEYWVKVVA